MTSENNTVAGIEMIEVYSYCDDLHGKMLRDHIKKTVIKHIEERKGDFRCVSVRISNQTTWDSRTPVRVEFISDAVIDSDLIEQSIKTSIKKNPLISNEFKDDRFFKYDYEPNLNSDLKKSIGVIVSRSEEKKEEMWALSGAGSAFLYSAKIQSKMLEYFREENKTRISSLIDELSDIQEDWANNSNTLKPFFLEQFLTDPPRVKLDTKISLKDYKNILILSKKNDILFFRALGILSEIIPIYTNYNDEQKADAGLFLASIIEESGKIKEKSEEAL